MSSSSSPWIAFVVFVTLTLATNVKCGTNTECGIAQTAFGECVPYMTGAVKEVAPICCTGVKDVMEMTQMPLPASDVCNCLLSMMSTVGKNIDYGQASSLAGKCGISTSVIPTSLNYKC